MQNRFKSWMFSSLFLFLSISWISCGQDALSTPVTPEVVEEEVDQAPDTQNAIEGTIRPISSMALVSEMGIGWNLGNSFDVLSKDKTFWGNPLSTPAHIRDIKSMGFSTLRIPITWNFNQEHTSPYEIEQDYLNRIQLIVNEALRNDMHVIINTHHDEWIIPTNAESEKVKNRLSSLWTQVARFFEPYGDHLLFEVMNEPRLRNSPEEWSGGTQEGRNAVNEYHKVSVDAIRATEGNNSNRHLMISTYAASSNSSAMRDLIIPNNDPNIIISIHSYFPWAFAGLESGTNIWGSDEEKRALDDELNRIRERWVVQENRPVILGEWGTTDKGNLSSRVEYCTYYAKAATELGLLPIIWDDGGNFGLYDRHAMNWKYPEIAEAVIAAVE